MKVPYGNIQARVIDSSAHIVKFEDFTITVNPGETVTIELYAHIAQTAVIGNEHSFELTSIYSDADSVTGLPIKGEFMKIE